MMNIFEWIVWTALAIFTFTMLITWFQKKRSYQHGHFYPSSEVVTLYAIPRIFLAETILLLIFLFIDVNKLNLLWLYPAIYFPITYWWAKKVVKEDEERASKEK